MVKKTKQQTTVGDSIVTGGPDEPIAPMSAAVTEGPKVPLRDIQIDEYLLECVAIEPTMLDDEFVRMPMDMAYWNERYSAAIRDHLMAKLHYDNTRAKVLLETRVHIEQSGLKRTVGDVDAMVTTDPRVVDAYLQYVEAEAQRQAIRNRCEAVQIKREMLQSLGAKYRVEMQTDPVVRDHLLVKQNS